MSLDVKHDYWAGDDKSVSLKPSFTKSSVSTVKLYSAVNCPSKYYFD